jgi:hypothetical protein
MHGQPCDVLAYACLFCARPRAGNRRRGWPGSSTVGSKVGCTHCNSLLPSRIVLRKRGTCVASGAGPVARGRGAREGPAAHAAGSPPPPGPGARALPEAACAAPLGASSWVHTAARHGPLCLACVRGRGALVARACVLGRVLKNYGCTHDKPSSTLPVLPAPVWLRVHAPGLTCHYTVFTQMTRTHAISSRPPAVSAERDPLNGR